MSAIRWLPSTSRTRMQRPIFDLSRKSDSNIRWSQWLSFMEYKGTQYQVVQTSNPTGWRWTVRFAESRTKTGSCYNRTVAIALAQRAIDREVEESFPKKGRVTETVAVISSSAQSTQSQRASK